MTEPPRCPDCALPQRWVDHPNPNLRGWHCYGIEAADRHAVVALKQRAAAMCAAAGYDTFAAVIWADLEAIRTPQRSAAA